MNAIKYPQEVLTPMDPLAVADEADAQDPGSPPRVHISHFVLSLELDEGAGFAPGTEKVCASVGVQRRLEADSLRQSR